MLEMLEFLAIHASSKAAVATHGNAQALLATKNISSVKRTGCGSESQSSGEAGKLLGNVHRVSPRLFSERSPFGQNVEGLSYFRDESCDLKIEFNTHSEMLRCSESVKPTSFAVKRLAVQILSPVQAPPTAWFCSPLTS